ncbi:MAG: fibronectin type III domain-containing protein, partial [Candidatus Sericytochromatia bacterium]|nr:fibronectin type III domain-containing protein [Candidatus Sericytochromatia bacterium]
PPASVLRVEVTSGVGALTLTWVTPFRALGGVRYRPAASTVWRVQDEAGGQLVTQHQVHLRNLQPWTTYELQVFGQSDTVGAYQSGLFTGTTR